VTAASDKGKRYLSIPFENAFLGTVSVLQLSFMAHRLLLLAPAFCTLIALIGCDSGQPEIEAPSEAPPPLVYAGNYPLQFFAQSIAGDRVDVRLPFPEDIDPAEWRPTDADILALQQADLILLNGAGYEGWLETVVLDPARLADTSASFRDRWIEEEEEYTHSHGPEGEHTHGGIAFTTWLDPLLAAEQAKAVGDALARLLPEKRGVLESNTATLVTELEELDRLWEATFALRPGIPLIASHPVYQYLERRYDLHLRSVHWEPDEHPEEQEWRAFANLLEEHPATVMLWEEEPLPETKTRLDVLGIAIAVFNPGSQPPEEGDFLSLMRENSAALEAALRETAEPPPLHLEP